MAYTHYMPNSWRHRCNTYDVRDEFLTLFRFRVELFVQVRVRGAVQALHLIHHGMEPSRDVLGLSALCECMCEF